MPNRKKRRNKKKEKKMLLGSFLVLARHALPTQAQNNMNAQRIKEAYKIGRLCTVLYTLRKQKTPLPHIHVTLPLQHSFHPTAFFR
jgi:hypothetical protein